MLEREQEGERKGTELRRSRSGVPFRGVESPGEENAARLAGPGNPHDVVERREEIERRAPVDPAVDSDEEVDGEPDSSEDDADFEGDIPFESDEFTAPVERAPMPRAPRVARRRRLLTKGSKTSPLTPEQRLLILDTWKRSGLPAGDFAGLVGISKHTLYSWKKRFTEQGPAGLLDQPRGAPKGSRLPELTKRTILMLKESNPDWGCQRISDLLARGPALPASPSAVARILHEAGYQVEESPTRPHAPVARRFERARPNELWQTDLFTFMLKRQNRRVYLVAFLDDASRFLVGYGLHASQSTALVLEVLRASITSHGTPQEILTDNGAQYITWRGKSAFSKELEKRGVRQIVASPRRPQTLGKIERFWGTLWRECVETAIFLDLADARRRIGLFIDHYNFQRPHRGIDGLAPADRYFGAASEVARSMKERVAANALELARNGVPKEPFYVTGAIGGKPFSLHAEGERVVLMREGQRKEVELAPPASMSEGASQRERPLPTPICPDGSPRGEAMMNPEDLAPGASPLDEGLRRIAEALDPNSSADFLPEEDVTDE